MKPEIEVERRAGMITGASCGHTSLTWLPSAGRHGVRTWVLSTDDGGTIRRIRLSPRRNRLSGGHSPNNRE